MSVLSGAGAELSPFAAKAIRNLDEERKKHPFRYVGESFSDFKQVQTTMVYSHVLAMTKVLLSVPPDQDPRTID